MSDFDLDAFLPYQLTVLAARVSHGFSDLYRQKFGISIPEWRVVAHLSQAGPVSVREIHQKVDMDKSKVSRAATRLEAAGYVTKRINHTDRRLVELELTANGRAMIDELTPIAQTYEAEVLAMLGDHAPCFRAALETLLKDGKDD
ncbi:MAG: MarR family transcriptional regulator [Marinosulfonomonas sp.]|nr:MarR family transcriptional regulator [Marinosulfonomonas sp.]